MSRRWVRFDQAEASIATSVIEAAEPTCFHEADTVDAVTVKVTPAEVYDTSDMTDATPFRAWLSAALETDEDGMPSDQFWAHIGCQSKGKQSRFREVIRELPKYRLHEDKKSGVTRLEELGPEEAAQRLTAWLKAVEV